MKKEIKYSVGDRVVMINDTISGVITKIDGDLITFETEEGFPYHCKTDEIIPQRDLGDLLNRNHSKKIHDKDQPDIRKKWIKPVNAPPMEVDLHIHQLTDSTKGMSNYDMLSLQLNTAKQKLNFALKNKIRKIVFIHGVGEGVLKKELMEMLRKYPVEISEANFHKYGLGATEVYIFQNYKEL